MVMERKRGKPKKFTDIKSLMRSINDYFRDADTRKAPYTITGLANALDTSRQLLLDIEYGGHYDSEFSRIISAAKSKIGQYTEEGLLSGKYNAAGCIFTMKNNWGYKDQVENKIVEDDSSAKILEANRKRVIEMNPPKQIEEAKVVEDE